MDAIIKGDMLIGQTAVHGSASSFQAVDPATGLATGPAFGEGTTADVERAADLARQAFDAYRETTPAQRAALLEQIAVNILDLGPALIRCAMQETGLPQARLEGERGRTVGQLRLFARVVRDGHWLAATLDAALPERTPPRPDLRLRRIALGPVAVKAHGAHPCSAAGKAAPPLARARRPCS